MADPLSYPGTILPGQTPGPMQVMDDLGGQLQQQGAMQGRQQMAQQRARSQALGNLKMPEIKPWGRDYEYFTQSYNDLVKKLTDRSMA